MLKLNFSPRKYQTLLAAAIGSVCLLPFPAHAQAFVRPAATVVEMTGRVSVLRNGEFALFKDKPVYAGETVITGPDSFARFELPDHSTFEIFEKSQVVFQDGWPSLTTLLNVMLGRVKVYIDHSKGPNYKQVQTPTAVISVRGTYFDVVVEDADGTTYVSVDEGKVRVQPTTVASIYKDLYAGDEIRIYRNQPLGQNKGLNDFGFMQKVLKASRDAVYQVMLGRGQTGAIPGGPGGGTTGAQGDKGKQTGSTSGAPAPPPPPGGGH